MASAKEIQNRIKSIQDTMKITKAMYMMSSMKLRKARQKLDNTEPYFNALHDEITDILLHFPDMEHLYFDNRESDKAEVVKKKGYIVVTGDKGMAGAYNHNIIKEAQRLINDEENYTLYVIGEYGRHFFTNLNYNVESEFAFSTTNPSIHRARVMTEHIIDDLYRQDKLDEVYVIYTKMINSMREEVCVERILPLKTHTFIKEEMIDASKIGEANYDKEALEKADDWFLIYPSPSKVLEKLIYSYLTGLLYGVLVESSASEENARMMAMQSATNNAEAMLAELSIEYNRVRQAAITQEITEVIGGAKALKKKKKKQER